MRNDAYKEYIRLSMRHNYYVRLENLTTELSNLIRYSKTEYHSELARKLLINNELISNFETKANYFNRLFIQQCTAISTDSSIPSSVNLATNETVTKINFDEQLISNLILALRPNKAHGDDGLSLRMLKWVLIL